MTKKTEMTDFKTKQILAKLERIVKEITKPVYHLNQMYQQQPFGRMTSLNALAMEKTIHTIRTGKQHN